MLQGMAMPITFHRPRNREHNKVNIEASASAEQSLKNNDGVSPPRAIPK